ncbi:MAG: hypothetical protein M5U19_14600 [Microthrixaceae bacterium]|nr:hypothetical protein [Microthrixaceae bacterium]
MIRDDATSHGPSVTNTARVTWTSLPGTHSSSLSPYTPLGVERTGSTSDAGGSANTYNTSGSATVAVNTSAVTKSLTGTSATHTAGSQVTIGETTDFTLAVTVPDGDLGTVTVTDVLPGWPCLRTGIGHAGSGSFAGTWTGSPALFAAQMSGNNVNFVFEDMSVSSGPGTSDNTFGVTITARVADVPGNQAGTTLSNIGRVTVAGTQFNSPPVDLTVVVPALSVTKSFTPMRPPQTTLSPSGSPSPTRAPRPPTTPWSPTWSTVRCSGMSPRIRWPDGPPQRSPRGTTCS